jgi:hypothetical protein
MSGEVRGFELTPALQTLFASEAWRPNQLFRGAASLNDQGSAAPGVTSGTLHGCKTTPRWWQSDWLAAETIAGGSTFAFHMETAVLNNGNARVTNPQEPRARRGTIWFP